MLTQLQLWYKTLLLSTLLLLSTVIAIAFNTPNDSVTLSATISQEGKYLCLSYEIPDSLHGKHIYVSKPKIKQKNSTRKINVLTVCGEGGRMIANAGTKVMRWNMLKDDEHDLKEVQASFSLRVIEAELVDVGKNTRIAVFRPNYARNKVDCINLNTKNCNKQKKQNRWVGIGIGALALTASVSAATAYVDLQAVNNSSELSKYNRWKDYCKNPQNNTDKTYCAHKRAGIVALAATGLLAVSISLNTKYVHKHSKKQKQKFENRRFVLPGCEDDSEDE